MSKIKFLAIALCISFAGIFASCYYDYGIDPNNSEIVGTIYNDQYNFGAISHYYMRGLVNSTGNATYDSLIIQTMRSNLTSLGWQPSADSVGTGVIALTAGVTTSTVTVNSGYNWWGYYGYSWYYPDYYSYSYTYQTGTLVMLMSDLNGVASGGNAPIEWSGILNAAVGQGTPTTTLITQGINQAFAQSPYLDN